MGEQAQGASAQQSGARRTLQQARGAHGKQARGASSSRSGARAVAGAERGKGAGRGRGPQPGLAAGPANCTLGALGLFLTRFDSILFLSQFLDIVREPGS